jgi:hypothetical protein
LKRPFIFFEARWNAFLIEAISAGVKGLEIKGAVPSSSREYPESARDVVLEEYFDFFMAKALFA